MKSIIFLPMNKYNVDYSRENIQYACSHAIRDTKRKDNVLIFRKVERYMTDDKKPDFTPLFADLLITLNDVCIQLSALREENGKLESRVKSLEDDNQNYNFKIKALEERMLDCENNLRHLRETFTYD